VFISRSTVLTLNALRPCFLIHLSTLYLVTSHQIGNKKRIIRENLCICTAVLVSVLFHLHGFPGLSFSGNVLLPTSLLVRPFKQPFLVPTLSHSSFVDPIFGPFLTELGRSILLFTVP
jgi:hypothetical protein